MIRLLATGRSRCAAPGEQMQDAIAKEALLEIANTYRGPCNAHAARYLHHRNFGRSTSGSGSQRDQIANGEPLGKRQKHSES
jgi:hypothetical protein